LLADVTRGMMWKKRYSSSVVFAPSDEAMDQMSKVELVMKLAWSVTDIDITLPRQISKNIK